MPKSKGAPGAFQFYFNPVKKTQSQIDCDYDIENGQDEEHQESDNDDLRDLPDSYAPEAAINQDEPELRFGFGGSKPERKDKDGNQIITVVDRSGIHEIGIRWCCCPEAPDRDLQLMSAGLFPATFRNPKTAFTFQVLTEFHLDNLECKTTPSQFFSRLKRLTNDEFPNTVPVR